MTKHEAIKVLEMIKTMYPKADMPKAKIHMLIPVLEKMDYNGVMENLSKHVARSPFAPTIQEIAAYPSRDNRLAAKMAKWREEAARVPQETREEFWKQMNELLRGKGNA